MTAVTTAVLHPDPQRFPPGTQVSAYRANAWSGHDRSVPPTGAADVGPIAVAADGSLSFAGLTDQTTYFAWAADSGAPVRFATRHDYADDFATLAADTGADQPEGSIKVAAGDGQPATWTQALDRLPIPAYGASDLVVPAPLPNLLSANGVPGGVQRLNLVRALATRKGRLRNFSIAVATLPTSGVFEAGIYDIDGFRLWTTGSQTAATYVAALGWMLLGDPKVNLDAGEPFFYAFLNDTNTFGAYRYPVGNVIGMDLPFNEMPEGNGKISAYLPGQTTLPAYIDPNSFIASTLLWAMIGKMSA
jgi:hypothetical protein